MDLLDTYLSDNHEYYGFKYSGVKGTYLRRKIGGWVNVTRYLSLVRSTRTNEFRAELEQDTNVLELRGKSINIAYTGCWVPLNRARELARKYAIYDQLRPLLGFDRVAKVNHCGVQLLEMFVIINFDVFVRILRRCDNNMVNIEGLFLLDKLVSPDGEVKKNIRRQFLKSYQGVRIESTEHTLLGGFWVPLNVARQFSAKRGLGKYTDPILGFSLFPVMNAKEYIPLNSVEERLANTWIVESPNNSVFYGLPESFRIPNFTKTSKPITLKDVCYRVQLNCNVKRGLTKKLVVLKRKSDSWVNASILINVCCSLRKAMSPNDTNVDNELYYHQMVYSLPFERVQFGRATTLNGRWVPLSHARELFKEMQVKFLGPYKKYATQLQKLLEPVEPMEEHSLDDKNDEVTILLGRPKDANAPEAVPVPPISLSSDDEMDEPPTKSEMVPENKMPKAPELVILSDSESPEATSTRIPQPAIQSSRAVLLCEKIKEFGNEMDSIQKFSNEHRAQLDNILSDLGLLSGSEIRFMRELSILKVLETVNKRMTADMHRTGPEGGSEEINRQFNQDKPSSGVNSQILTVIPRHQVSNGDGKRPGGPANQAQKSSSSSSSSTKTMSTPSSSLPPPLETPTRPQAGWKQAWGVFQSILSKAQPSRTTEETTATTFSDSLSRPVPIIEGPNKKLPSLNGNSTTQSKSDNNYTQIRLSSILEPRPYFTGTHSFPGKDPQSAQSSVANDFIQSTNERLQRTPSQSSAAAQTSFQYSASKQTESSSLDPRRQKMTGNDDNSPDPKRRRTMSRGDIVKSVRALHKPLGHVERIMAAYNKNTY
ncbi:BA75_02665T0 [Komagataella pastoris]|uniref:BA75_02665T0 n=1 Tax=Komagataella pastoris TaxID=4922 RepID=A0A1B2JA52_PICPA|nr:BA75_02665T0 [Komagataella pastoris]